jgi:hypothetical protein
MHIIRKLHRQFMHFMKIHEKFIHFTTACCKVSVNWFYVFFSILKIQKKIRRVTLEQQFGLFKLLQRIFFHLTKFGRVSVFFIFETYNFTVKYFFFLNFKISEIWKNCSKTHFFKIIHTFVSIVNRKSFLRICNTFFL